MSYVEQVRAALFCAARRVTVGTQRQGSVAALRRVFMASWTMA